MDDGQTMDDNGRGAVAPGTAFAALGTAELALLTTFRRDGRGIASPVGVAIRDERVYFMTLPGTGKVARLASAPRVALAACSHRGERHGPAVAGVARRLTGVEAERARAAMADGFWGRLWLGTARFRREQPLVFEVAPATADGGP